jgi:hypothetical protein
VNSPIRSIFDGPLLLACDRNHPSLSEKAVIPPVRHRTDRTAVSSRRRLLIGK